jgi:hypothetical protein
MVHTTLLFYYSSQNSDINSRLTLKIVGAFNRLLLLLISGLVAIFMVRDLDDMATRWVAL